VYLLARPQATAAQRRSRDLVVALSPELFDALRCEACGEMVDEEWRRCPTCASWLQVACIDCGRWSATNLEICPWCATSRVDEEVVAIDADLARTEEPDVAAVHALEPDTAAADALEPDEVAAAYALEPDEVMRLYGRPATAPLPVFSILHEVPVLAPALADASTGAIIAPTTGTPDALDFRRSRRGGRGFGDALDETPAAIGR
jgi:RNA polymerase subunit RPABC4/transcription elongation factor Spt4